MVPPARLDRDAAGVIKEIPMMIDDKHVMTMLVDNEPGVLSRVVGLFSGKASTSKV